MEGKEVETVPPDVDSPDVAEVSKPILRVSRVPLELWCEIAQYVDTRSLLRLGAVSTSLSCKWYILIFVVFHLDLQVLQPSHKFHQVHLVC